MASSKTNWKKLKEQLNEYLKLWNELTSGDMQERGNNIFFYGTFGEIKKQIKNTLNKFHPDLLETKIDKLEIDEKSKDALNELSKNITQVLNSMGDLTKGDINELKKLNESNKSFDDLPYTIVNEIYKREKEKNERGKKYSGNIEFSTGKLRISLNEKNEPVQFERKICIYIYRQRGKRTHFF